MVTPTSEFDEQMMRRAIRLAMNGRGGVEPNPMVGCVIVKDGRVIGEGYHAQYGGPHAEPTALAACTESPAGATAYVTLEPCCHTNKKTPPCAPRLIEAKFARVVIGCLDPNPDVNGKGVAALSAAGLHVDGPVLEFAAKQLIAAFSYWLAYETIKWAESADGKIAGPGGRRVQITNALSTRVVHELRSRCDAIAVGIDTVLADDPLLTPRDVVPVRRPGRFVLDTHLRIPLDCRLVRTAREAPLVVCASPGAIFDMPEKIAALNAAGVEISDCDEGADGRIQIIEFRTTVSQGVRDADRSIRATTHLLVEAGPTLAASLLTDCQRLWVFRSPKLIGDATAPAAPQVPASYIKTGELDLDGDILTEYLNPAGSAFFSAEPSADFVLTRARVEWLTPPR